MPDDANRVQVADLLDAEHARPVVAAERRVAPGLVDGAVELGEVDVGDRLAVLEDDVAVGAGERALVVEAQRLGDDQVAVLGQPQGDVGVDDVGGLRERRSGRRERGDRSREQREGEPRSARVLTRSLPG